MAMRIGPTNNVCYICRKPLEQPKRGRLRLTCSDACRQARYRHLRLGQQHWYYKRQKKLVEKRRALPIGERRFDKGAFRPVFELSYRRNVYECMACGEPYVVDRINRGGNTRYYCSPACKDKSSHQWEKFGKALRKHEIDPKVMRRYQYGKLSPLCAHCDKPFAPNTDLTEGHKLRGRPRKYCSTECGKLAYEKRWKQAHEGKARLHRFHECAECGTKFDRTDKQGQRSRRFCRKECAAAFRWRSYAARRKAKKAGQQVFKWASSGRRAATLGALKNRSKKVQRNELAGLFSGGVADEGCSGTNVREKEGIKKGKKPAFTSKS